MAASNDNTLLPSKISPRQRDFILIADLTKHRIAIVNKAKTSFKFHGITIRAPYSGEREWDEKLDLQVVHEKIKGDTAFYFCIRADSDDVSGVWAMPASLAGVLKDIFARKLSVDNMADDPFLTTILRHSAVDEKKRDWTMNRDVSYFKEEFLPYSPCDVFSVQAPLAHAYYMQNLVFLEKPAALAYPVFRHRNQIVEQFRQEGPLFYGYRNCRACHNPVCMEVETDNTPLIVCPQCAVTSYCSEKCIQDDKPRHAGNCMTEDERKIRIAIDIEQRKFLFDMDRKGASFSKEQLNTMCENIAVNVRNDLTKKG